jgi:hypothetical protein
LAIFQALVLAVKKRAQVFKRIPRYYMGDDHAGGGN